MHINNKFNIDCSSGSDRIKIISQDKVVEYLSKCELFVSDYSGMILDALYVDKPVVFFHMI